MVGISEDSQENIYTQPERYHEYKIEQFKEEHSKYQSTQEEKMAKIIDNTVVNNRRQFPRTSVAEKIDVASLNSEEINSKIKELYEKIDGVWTCRVCEHICRDKTDIGRHVESHLDGLCYTCNFCSKEFR